MLLWLQPGGQQQRCGIAAEINLLLCMTPICDWQAPAVKEQGQIVQETVVALVPDD